jgi:soluble lytic murein transglycosylase-like protein
MLFPRIISGQRRDFRPVRSWSALRRFLPAALGLLAASCFACAALAGESDAPLRDSAAWRAGIAGLEQYRRGNGPAPAPLILASLRVAAPGSRLPLSAPAFNPQLSKAAPDWTGIIRGASRRYGVDEALLTAVIRVESNFNPWAVSRRGARGAMQIMPETGKKLGLADFFNPEANVDAGARYLAEMLRLFPSLELSLAAYNAGPEAVRRYGGSLPPYLETRRYVDQVLAAYSRLSLQRAK